MPNPTTSAVSFYEDEAITIQAAATQSANRLIAYDGGYATSAGGAKDAVGISKFNVAAGENQAVVIEHSYPLQVSEAVVFGDYLKPAADGSGMGAKGTIADHCARAMSDAAAGQLVDAHIRQHVHA